VAHISDGRAGHFDIDIMILMLTLMIRPDE
jgi:hypothetical protein